MDANRPMPRHIVIKIPKVKERILKVGREKQRVTYKGIPITLLADFSKETKKGLTRSIRSGEKQGPTT